MKGGFDPGCSEFYQKKVADRNLPGGSACAQGPLLVNRGNSTDQQPEEGEFLAVRGSEKGGNK
jgi:hypothetical protein